VKGFLNRIDDLLKRSYLEDKA